MIFKQNTEFWIDFRDNTPYLTCFDCELSGDDNVIDKIVVNRLDQSDGSEEHGEIGFELTQKLENLMDSYIDANRFCMIRDEVFFDTEEKEKVEILKNSLISVIEKLNGIKFLTGAEYDEKYDAK